jgi:tetratricopeptide (TPR) repeat protein
VALKFTADSPDCCICGTEAPGSVGSWPGGFRQVVRLSTGDRSGALAAYEESLSIVRELVAADSTNSSWQRDLSVGLEKIGNVRLAAGDRARALAAYEASLDVRRKLAEADPGNAGWQADLVIGLYKVSTASDPSRARAVLHEALAIAEALARDGELTAGQQNWPQLLRDALAKLPPEAAEAR